MVVDGGFSWAILAALLRRKGGVGAGDGEKEERNRANLLVERCVLSPTGLARAFSPFTGAPRRNPARWVRPGTPDKIWPKSGKKEALGARLGGKWPAGVKKWVLGGLSGGRLELLLWLYL